MATMFLVILFLQHIRHISADLTHLDKDQKYALDWSIWNTSACTEFGFEVDCIEIALEVEAKGWIGFGISKNGFMTDSDIVIGWIDEQNRAHLELRYTSETRTMPIFVKDITHTITSSSKTGNITRISFVRSIPACKTQQKIEVGTTKIIYAWNDNIPKCATHQNCDMHWHSAANCGEQFINFFSKPKDTQMPPNTHYFDLVNDNYKIEPLDTVYYCKFMRFDIDNIDKAHHVIRIDPVIQSGNEGFVHHIIVERCDGFDPRYLDIKGQCSHTSGTIFNKFNCKTTIMEWAIGRGNFYFPKHVGLELGGTDKHRLEYVKITFHYNNPLLLSNITDSSGLRFYYTPVLRQHSAMIMSVEHPSTHIFIPGGIEKSITYGHCISQCTKAAYTETGIHIISIAFHMHLTGVAGKLRQIRNGTELKPINENKSYNNSYQEFVLLNEERNVLPGDELLLECHYNTLDRVHYTVGGESVNDEMCIAWMIVYPKNDLTECWSEPGVQRERQFYSAATDNGYLNMNTQIYDATNEKAVQLYNDYLVQAQRMAYCPRFFDAKPFVAPEAKYNFVPYFENINEKNESEICDIQRINDESYKTTSNDGELYKNADIVPSLPILNRNRRLVTITISVSALLIILRRMWLKIKNKHTLGPGRRNDGIFDESEQDRLLSPTTYNL